MKNTEQYSAIQVRMALDLAVELDHVNKGIASVINLYAAAPELLEAAKDLVLFADQVEITGDQITLGALLKIKAAIAKAERTRKVATVHMNKANGAREGNARLIAAAPDMLQTLKHILDLAKENTKEIDGYCQIAEWADNQIAKAEGRA